MFVKTRHGFITNIQGDIKDRFFPCFGVGELVCGFGDPELVQVLIKISIAQFLINQPA